MINRVYCPVLRGLLALTVVTTVASAQTTSLITISGRVLDDSTSTPVVNANVFISNSMRGTSSDTSGHFEIKGLPPGSYDLVASCVGYTMVSTRIQLLASTEAGIEIRLRPKVLGLGVVEVVAPSSEAWEKDLQTFKTLLLGATEEASNCKLLNPEILEFSSDGFGGFQAQANQVLIIENVTLGYRLHLSLGIFDRQQRWLSASWKVRFEELKPSDADQQSTWKKNRENAYAGSLRHFLVSLLKERLSQEGFKMFFSKTLKFNQPDQYSLFLLERDDVARPCGSDQWAMSFDDYLVVVYNRAGGYDGLGRVINTRFKTSALVLEKDSVVVDSRGQFVEQNTAARTIALRVFGDWGKEGLARDLPLEFEPGSEK